MRRPYLVAAAVALLPATVVLVIAAIRPDVLAVAGATRVEDFGAYWTGTVVNLQGGNPYNPAELAPLQSKIEPTRPEPLPAWSPPWTFAALLPFAPLDFAPARWVWAFAQVGMLLVAVTAVWRMYGGPLDRLFIAWVAAFVWYPTIQTLGTGQHSSLVLVAVAGWVALVTSGRPVLGGMVLALVLVKPQNLHLLGLLVAVWAVDRRAWGVLVGGLTAAAVLTLAAVVPNPDIFTLYRQALADRPPSQMVPPTIGSVLRGFFGDEHYWLAFLPVAVGVVWAVWYYLRHRGAWTWPDRLPLVLFASYLTTPYGWVYDQVLFLIPLTQLLALAAKRRPTWVTPMVLGVAALTAICLGLNVAKYQEFSFVWLAPLSLVLYLILHRLLTRR